MQKSGSRIQNSSGLWTLSIWYQRAIFSVAAFIAQFSLLDIFTQKSKHLGRLRWLTYGGDEGNPVEIPVDERSLVLSNLFTAIYYATQRARVVSGQPWDGERLLFKSKSIFKGRTFSSITLETIIFCRN